MTAKGPGEALANAHDDTRCDVGMCLRYVRTWWEVGSLYGSAIEAWNGARHKHPGDRTPPKGAPLFYRGGNYGHIVIADPGHQGCRSTDCKSSGVVSDAEIAWTEVTWGYTYLGWTEDLNGVTLPLDSEDEMTEDDWDRLEDLVRRVVWEEHMTVTQPNGTDASKAREQVVRETYQTVKRAN
jgi:hypothetical protein